jgi:hypothetical protein
MAEHRYATIASEGFVGRGTGPHRERIAFGNPNDCSPIRARQRSTTEAQSICAKQSQFAPHRPGRTPAGKAATAAAAGGKRAKQSQFLPSDTKGKYPMGKGVMTNRTRKGPRRNKANFRPDGHGPGPASLPGPRAGPILRNKANLPRTERKRRRPPGPRVLPLLGTSVRNKANSPRASGEASTLREKEL